MHKEIEARVEQAIRGQVFPGCVIGIVRKEGGFEILPFGHVTYGRDASAVHENTLYDVASVTKSIPTASFVLILADKGGFSLNDEIKQHLPELKNEYGATIEDLLSYRVTGLQMSSLAGETPEGITKHVFESGFGGPPGKPLYTNLPAFLLGLIVERVTGESLDRLAQERFFDPLNMIRTTFFPTYRDCAPTETDIRGIPHDESARVFAKAGKAVGHAGLFSTAPDLLNFLEALLKDVLPDVLEGARKGLGWQTEGEFLGSRPEKRFGKTGFTGCSVTCDAEKGIALVILSNRTYPERPTTQDAINAFRRDMSNIVFENVW